MQGRRTGFCRSFRLVRGCPGEVSRETVILLPLVIYMIFDNQEVIKRPDPVHAQA